MERWEQELGVGPHLSWKHRACLHDGYHRPRCLRVLSPNPRTFHAVPLPWGVFMGKGLQDVVGLLSGSRAVPSSVASSPGS